MHFRTSKAGRDYSIGIKAILSAALLNVLCVTAAGQPAAASPTLTKVTLKAVLSGHEKEIITLAFSPDGALIATGSKDGTVRLWSAATGEARGILRVIRHTWTMDIDW